MISAANALRPGEPLTDEEMKNRVCTCPENPDVDEWGDNSWLPCMSMKMGLDDIGLHCNTCIYCQPKNKSQMKELITKNSDGTFTYDFHKFFTFDDAIMAEWKLNSPELDKAVLSKIMEKVYNKESFCTDGKGRQRPNRWDAYVEKKAKMLTSKREKCYCEELLEQYRNDNNDKEVVISGDSTFGPVIAMGISEDPWTKKRLYVYLAAYEEGSDYSDEDLKYCPFCGKKLTEIVK